MRQECRSSCQVGMYHWGSRVWLGRSASVTLISIGNASPIERPVFRIRCHVLEHSPAVSTIHLTMLSTTTLRGCAVQGISLDHGTHVRYQRRRAGFETRNPLFHSMITLIPPDNEQVSSSRQSKTRNHPIGPPRTQRISTALLVPLRNLIKPVKKRMTIKISPQRPH